MGAEVMCTATVGGRGVKGKARLETDVLQFRAAELTLNIPFNAMTAIAASEGMLTVRHADGTAAFALGAAAARWADRIQHPRSRLDKIGAKPAWKASAIGVDDTAFLDELKARVASLSIGRAARGSDAIFLGATSERPLARLAALKAALKPNGALWVIRPKGRPDISEAAVMRAGKAAGLVDVKVVSFSPTHTAEKFVIPIAKRPPK
jgi:hypothetical protein